MSFFWASEPAPWYEGLFSKPVPWYEEIVDLLVHPNLVDFVKHQVLPGFMSIAWAFAYWLAFVLVLALGYLWFVVVRWHKIFHDRLGRECADSPSNKRRPEVPELPPHVRGPVHIPGTAEIDRDKANAVQAKAESKCPFANLANNISAEADNPEIKKPTGKWDLVRNTMTPKIAHHRRGSSRKTVVHGIGIRHNLSEEKATLLDMDHVYCPLVDFIFVMCFVWPNMVTLMLAGYVRMRYQWWQVETGRRPVPDFDIGAQTCRVMLECPGLAFLYRGMERQDDITFRVAPDEFIAWDGEKSTFSGKIVCKQGKEYSDRKVISMSQGENKWSADGDIPAQDWWAGLTGIDDVVFNVQGNLIAEFVVEKMPFPLDNLRVYEAKLVVHLDLDARKAISGAIGSRQLSPADTYVFTSFYMLTSHVLSHSLANWGLNPHAPHPWVRRMAVISIMYNNLGFEGARLAFDNTLGQFQGSSPVFPVKDAWYPKDLDPLLYIGTKDSHDNHKQDSTGDCIQVCFHHNLKNSLYKHGQVRELMAHSPLVDFVVKVRNFFLNTFEDYRSEFPAIDAEAMFVGTIIHALDHSNLYDTTSATMHAHGREQSLRTDGDFKLMEDAARFSFAGLISDLPGIGFSYKYRDSPHPFYQKVYAFAKKINPVYADRMDACIIK